MKRKPLILLVNDDGVFSPGLRFLINICKRIGRVCVVAPNKEQSGRSHAITVDEKISFKKIKSNDLYCEYSCSGTPVDCVKLAINKLLHEKPDLCISGINHGANYSISTLYSATVHAAIEGTISGVNSFAISHLNYSNRVDMSSFQDFLIVLINYFLKNKIEQDVTLNINLPDISYGKTKGIKLCRQGKGKWIEKITKSNKKNECIISGHFEAEDKSDDTDIWALENSYISMVPIKIDMTNYDYIKNNKIIEHDFKKG
tara:strand:+ start:114 stop:887 length:774 start_codon:yes stop_codon:yes gene_type:complete